MMWEHIADWSMWLAWNWPLQTIIIAVLLTVAYMAQKVR